VHYTVTTLYKNSIKPNNQWTLKAKVKISFELFHKNFAIKPLSMEVLLQNAQRPVGSGHRVKSRRVGSDPGKKSWFGSISATMCPLRGDLKTSSDTKKNFHYINSRRMWKHYVKCMQAPGKKAESKHRETSYESLAIILYEKRASI